MIIIDGENCILGRVASYAAKQALQGEEIAILNCEKLAISGNKEFTKQNFKEKRGRIGSNQQGPKHSRIREEIVKRTIRGMLPNHRWGRGKAALGRIKCYVGIPKQFESAEKIRVGDIKRSKVSYIEEYKK